MSGWPTSQKDSLFGWRFLRSSVWRSVFISAFSRVTPAQRVSSMSFAASGSKAKAANTSTFGRGTSRRASSSARSTCFLSSGAKSGPKETTTRRGSVKEVIVGSAARRPASSSVRRSPSGRVSCAAVSPSAWIQAWPGSGSSRPNGSRCPPFPRIPARASSSSHCPRRLVAPLRATEASACPGSAGASGSSVSGATAGAGVASTVNGPATRFFPDSFSGWSYIAVAWGGDSEARISGDTVGTVR